MTPLDEHSWPSPAVQPQMWGSALSSGPAALRAAAVLERKEVKFPWKLPSSSSSDGCISIHAHMPCYFLIWRKTHLLSGCYAVCNARCFHFFFNNSFTWLSSAGNSDKGAGDKHEGVHESTVRGNSGCTVF